MATSRQDRLTISRELTFALRGADLVTWSSVQQEEKVLHPVILSVVARFGGGAEVAEVLPAVSPLFASEPPELREENALDFIDQIAATGLLGAVEPDDTPAATVPIAIEDIAPTTTGVNGATYAPRWSLALRPGAQGLIAWSPALERDILLTPPAIDLLCAFAGGKVFDGSGPTGLVDALVSARLLAEVPAPDASVDSAAAAAGPVRRTGHWQTPAPGKIPIYAAYADGDGARNHSPLALGMVIAKMQSFEGGALLGRYAIVGIFSEEAALLDAVRACGPGIVLFSNYVWTIEFHLRASQNVKALSPGSIMVHGGPSVPKYDDACRDFFRENPHVDVAIHGEGEVTACEMLDALRRSGGGDLALALDGLRGVAGLAFRGPADEGVVRTGPRERVVDVDGLPSPYVAGVFDGLDPEGWSGAILETNRGCPYGCTFCDWGSATLGKVRRFSLERVAAEIEWIARNGIRLVYIADANFGILDRDVDITRMIVDANRRYGAPTEVKLTYAKNATARIAEIVSIFTTAGLAVDGVISIQTTDQTTLRDINRSNIKTERYDEILDVFRRQRLPLGTDLMIGLPGATVESFKCDLQVYFDRDVPVLAYATTLLPNSPMANPEYIDRYKIKTVKLGYMSYLRSTYSYTEDDWEEMNGIFAAYLVLVNYSVFRHVLYFLQWDHGVPVADFLHRLQSRLKTAPRNLSATAWMLQSFRLHALAPGGWRTVYDELVDFAAAEFGIVRDGALDAVLRVQEAVMPEQGRVMPERIALAHDYVAYYRERLLGSGAPVHPALDRYPPGDLWVGDPESVCDNPRTDMNLYYFHSTTIELRSALSRNDAPGHAFISNRGDVVRSVAAAEPVAA